MEEPGSFGTARGRDRLFGGTWGPSKPARPHEASQTHTPPPAWLLARGPPLRAASHTQTQKQEQRGLAVAKADHMLIRENCTRDSRAKARIGAGSFHNTTNTFRGTAVGPARKQKQVELDSSTGAGGAP